jgi:hypothetical protein
MGYPRWLRASTDALRPAEQSVRGMWKRLTTPDPEPLVSLPKTEGNESRAGGFGITATPSPQALPDSRPTPSVTLNRVARVSRESGTGGEHFAR